MLNLGEGRTGHHNSLSSFCVARPSPHGSSFLGTGDANEEYPPLPPEGEGPRSVQDCPTRRPHVGAVVGLGLREQLGDMSEKLEVSLKPGSEVCNCSF